jgi:hypothetical protein
MRTSTVLVGRALPVTPLAVTGLVTVVRSGMATSAVFSKGTPGRPGVPPPSDAAAEAIAEAKKLVWVYTPGFSGRAQPKPQLTMPTWTQALVLSRRNIGPPESPWQVSTPPSSQLPAQISSAGIRPL